MPLMEFQQAGKRYRDKLALDSVSLSVEPGECVGLLGHNGAGKTTMIKLALGLIAPTTGSVRVFGADPACQQSRTKSAMVGYLPESIALHENLTGYETLRFYARLKGASTRGVADLLERVGLATAASARVKTYSKGMRQRLGLAQALLGAPALLMLDEPTNGLDPAFRRAFYGILAEVVAQGSAVVISSHALSELEPHIRRAVILRAGRLVAQGSLAELSRQSQLPTRIRIITVPGEAAATAQRINTTASICHVNGCAVDIRCSSQEKLALLSRIGDLGDAVTDVEVDAPSLDDVFAHLTDREAAP